MGATISTNRPASIEVSQRFLRRMMTADSIFCAVSGLGLIFFEQPIATFLGAASPLIILTIGLILLGTALFIFVSLRDAPLEATKVRLLIAGNALWVVASIALVIANPLDLTNGGKLAVLAQAFLTADVAFFEWLGWRRGR
jgi:hypothetical protein